MRWLIVFYNPKNGFVDFHIPLDSDKLKLEQVRKLAKRMAKKIYPYMEVFICRIVENFEVVKND